MTCLNMPVSMGRVKSGSSMTQMDEMVGKSGKIYRIHDQGSFTGGTFWSKSMKVIVGEIVLIKKYTNYNVIYVRANDGYVHYLLV